MVFIAKQWYRFNGTLTDYICLGKWEPLRRTLGHIILTLLSVIRFLIILYSQKDLNKASDLWNEFLCCFPAKLFTFKFQFFIGEVLDLYIYTLRITVKDS